MWIVCPTNSLDESAAPSISPRCERGAGHHRPGPRAPHDRVRMVLGGGPGGVRNVSDRRERRPPDRLKCCLPQPPWRCRRRSHGTPTILFSARSPLLGRFDFVALRPSDVERSDSQAGHRQLPTCPCSPPARPSVHLRPRNSWRTSGHRSTIRSAPVRRLGTMRSKLAHV